MTGFSLLDDIDWSKLGQVSPMVTTDADRAVVGDTATAINPDWSLGKTSNLDQPNAVGLTGEHADKQQPGAVQAGRWQVPPPGVNTEPTDSRPGVGDIIGGVLTAPFRALRAVDYTVKRGLGIADSPESQIYSARSALRNAANADPEAASTIAGLQTYLNSSSPTAAGQRPTPPKGTGYGDIAQEWLNVFIPGQSPYDKAKAEGRQLSTMLQQLQGRKTLGDMVNTVSARMENRAQGRKANVDADLAENYGAEEKESQIFRNYMGGDLAGARAENVRAGTPFVGPLAQSLIDSRDATAGFTAEKTALLRKYGGPQAEAKLVQLEALTRLQGINADNAIVNGTIKKLQLELDQMYAPIERQLGITGKQLSNEGQGLTNTGRGIANERAAVGLESDKAKLDLLRQYGGPQIQAKLKRYEELSQAHESNLLNDQLRRERDQLKLELDRAYAPIERQQGVSQGDLRTRGMELANEGAGIGIEGKRVDVKRKIHDLDVAERWGDKTAAANFSRLTRPTGTARGTHGIPTFQQYRNEWIRKNNSVPSDEQLWKEFDAKRKAVLDAYTKHRDDYQKLSPGNMFGFGNKREGVADPLSVGVEQAKAAGLVENEDYAINAGQLALSPDSPEYREKVLSRFKRRGSMPDDRTLAEHYKKDWGDKLSALDDVGKVVITIDPKDPDALTRLQAAVEMGAAEIKQAQERGGTKAIVNGIDQSIKGKRHPATFDPGQETDQEMIVRLGRRGMSQADITKALVAKRQAAEKAARGR